MQCLWPSSCPTKELRVDDVSEVRSGLQLASPLVPGACTACGVPTCNPNRSAKSASLDRSKLNAELTHQSFGPVHLLLSANTSEPGVASELIARAHKHHEQAPAQDV